MKTKARKSAEIAAEPKPARNRTGRQELADKRPPEAAPPFETFTEWSGEADEKAFAEL